MRPFRVIPACLNIRNGADDARGTSLTPGAFEISTRMHLYPADLAASRVEPALDRVGLRIDGIERRLARPKPLRIVRMHPPHDLLDRRLVSGNIEDFFKTRIPRDHAAARIVLPPPEQSGVEGKLQARLARVQVALAVAQQVLCPRPPASAPSKFRH